MTLGGIKKAPKSQNISVVHCFIVLAYHSLLTALIQMFDSWINAFEYGEVSAVLMLDMSATFDVVDNHILLCKLEMNGFEDCALSSIKSYLSDRFQSMYR